MRIPFVIDNRRHKLADVLNAILEEHEGRAMDVATAFFTVDGFALLQEGLKKLRSFRLLLGAEPREGPQLGLRPHEDVVRRLIELEIERMPFDEQRQRLVEELIAFLQRDSVAVRIYKGEGAGQFLHAKCYLFYHDRPEHGGGRFKPVVGIVGSSNFTRQGLTTNRELNLAHKTVLDPEEMQEAQLRLLGEGPAEPVPPEVRQQLQSAVGAVAIAELDRWFQGVWEQAQDFKAELIELLDASKFGRKEYTPFEVYMKALYEYFKDQLGEDVAEPGLSVIELTEFQERAVKAARRILARYDGVMIADSVGLGKTWIGKKLLEDLAYFQRQKALVVCPASLRDMWQHELASASIAALVVSQEELGREEFDPGPYEDVDVILVDEAHNFRNPRTQRYEMLERIIGARGGKGKSGARKRVILMTATPIHNDLLDLYWQINLITQGDRRYFAAAGIGDLYRYFLRARKAFLESGQTAGLFNLLEEIVVRRTREFIRAAYPEATIGGKPVKFPKRRLKTIHYDLEATYEGIYEQVVADIESLRLAPYNLEAYKREGVEVDEMELGREQALVGIFKSRYLKRLESSIQAFRISIRRALEFLETFESYVLDGRLLNSSDFRRAMRYLSREEEDDAALPGSLAQDIDASEEARQIIEQLPEIDPSQYDLRRLHEDIRHDIRALQRIWERVRGITPREDAKLARLRELLAGELRGQKVLLFTYYRDTANYLYEQLAGENGRAWREQAGYPRIERMHSGVSVRNRWQRIARFAPRSNNRLDIAGTEQEIDILISTDVLAEGQNLQDAAIVINYDLHWNPMRMVQRAGRVDRLGAEFDTLWIYNFFPEKGLDRLLGLIESLNRKIEFVDRAGFHDASILGEKVHPRVFNTLQRIEEEDDTVIDEEARETELVSSEMLLHHLRAALDNYGRERLERLPNGIHSGLARKGERGVFFYFQAEGPDGQTLHFWRYVDLQTDRVIDNRYTIAQLIHCTPDTPRVIDEELREQVFQLQERAIEDVLESYRAQQVQQVAPVKLGKEQQSAAALLQEAIRSSSGERRKMLIATLRAIQQPLQQFQLRALRKALRQEDRVAAILAVAEETLGVGQRVEEHKEESERSTLNILTRDDLRLICFQFVTDE